MSPVGQPGTGWPDHEERPMPHGEAIDTATAFTATPGGVNLSGINVASVSAYRSTVVVVHVTGAHDVTVQVVWEWNSGAAHMNPSESKIVPAGTTKRLLFQNQGEYLDHIRVSAPAGNSNIDYYVTGSNLDPLPSSAPEYLLLTGIAHAIPAVVGGDSGAVPFDATQIVTSDTSLWTYDLDGGGNIVTVHATQTGRYESLCMFAFDAPSAAMQESCGVSLVGTTPNVQADSLITTAFPFDGFCGGFSELFSGTLAAQINYSVNANQTSSIRAQWWWLKLWKT